MGGNMVDPLGKDRHLHGPPIYMKAKTKKTNWRILLKDYMRHIISSEGISFIHNGYLTKCLTADQKNLLEKIEQEIDDEQ